MGNAKGAGRRLVEGSPDFRFRISKRILSIFTVAAITVGCAFAQNELEVQQVRPNFYMISGAGSNIAVQTGPDGTIVVDSGSAATSEAVVAAIRKISNNHFIRYVINTSADPDHVGGNDKVAQSGRTIFTIVENARGNLTSSMTNGGAAAIFAYESVLLNMSAPTGQNSAFPTASWPTETYNQKRWFMYFNGEGLEIEHPPAAHSDGDTIVFFRKSDVVAAGDIVDATRFPVINLERGGSIQGEIAALNRLLELVIPNIPLIWESGGTYVIPGHGRVYDYADLVEYRDMITVIRDRIENMIKQGMTLDQIKAASPTQGYTRQYGSDSGPWTTNMFVEAIYKSLTQKAKSE